MAFIEFPPAGMNIHDYLFCESKGTIFDPWPNGAEVVKLGNHPCTADQSTKYIMYPWNSGAC
jgi:hypothetical protein